MKHSFLVVISLMLLFVFSNGFAADELDSIQTKSLYLSHVEQGSDINRSDIFIFIGNFYAQYTPKTSQYIDIKFRGVPKTGDLHEALQVLVYSDFIQNTNTNIYPHRELKASDFYALCEQIFGVDFRDEEERFLRTRYTSFDDLKNVSDKLDELTSKIENETTTSSVDISSSSDSKDIKQKKAIFSDVYKTILSRHYDKDDLDEEEIIYSAIEGIAKGTGDKYTTYFPPVENESFQDSLNSEYEGIGSYVEMPEPGVVQIISPIVGSPSEKAGLKGGDIIIQIDDVIVTKDMSLSEAISYIKGPAGTSVDLTIMRGSQRLVITVMRAKIVIKEVEYESLRTDTFYIQIKNFGNKVDAEFKEALEELKAKKGTKKLIIDVRNNPGGYLGKVNNMLGYFVEEGKPVSVVKYQEGSATHKSRGYDLIDFSDYQIVFLQNGGTASASEILVGTVKDYYPDTILVGETTFGKGSVQDIKSYVDGSSLKFTIAKWFTGKSQNGIDGVGISPDIEIELDDEKFQQGIDNQLERALQVR